MEIAMMEPMIYGYMLVTVNHTRKDAFDAVCNFCVQIQEERTLARYHSQFPYIEGALWMYSSSCTTDHDRAMGIWGTLTQGFSERSGSNQRSRVALSALVKTLLGKAIDLNSAVLDSNSSSSYSAKLHDLCRQDTRSDLCPTNLRLCLVRLHVVHGNVVSALDEARRCMYLIFDAWPGEFVDGSLQSRLQGLSRTLTVLGDGSNAIAACQAVTSKITTDICEKKSCKGS